MDSCRSYLSTKAVQGTSLALEGVDHIEGGHGLAAGVLGVGDGVTDHVLKEHLKDTAGLLVDEATDTLNATTASQTPDGRLGDTCIYKQEVNKGSTTFIKTFTAKARNFSKINCSIFRAADA